MTPEQFATLISKLDGIGYALTTILAVLLLSLLFGSRK